MDSEQIMLEPRGSRRGWECSEEGCVNPGGGGSLPSQRFQGAQPGHILLRYCIPKQPPSLLSQ